MGVKRAGDFQLVFTLLKIVIIVAIAVLVFSAASGTVAQFRHRVSPEQPAVLPALWPPWLPRCGPTTDGTT